MIKNMSGIQQQILLDVLFFIALTKAHTTTREALVRKAGWPAQALSIDGYQNFR